MAYFYLYFPFLTFVALYYFPIYIILHKWNRRSYMGLLFPTVMLTVWCMFCIFSLYSQTFGLFVVNEIILYILFCKFLISFSGLWKSLQVFWFNFYLNLLNSWVLFHRVDIPNNLAVHLSMNIHFVSGTKQCHNKSEYITY